MTFSQLEASYTRYKADHDHAHQLFTDCLAYAREITSAYNPDREEIAADASWSAWSQFNTIDRSTYFAPWFTRVVVNKQRDYRRKAATRDRAESQGAYYPSRPLDTETVQRVREQAISHRPLVDLLLAGSSLDEAADALNITVRTLRRKLHATRKEQAAHE